jgi:tetratricopeptide (TPR) repeat protein
VSKKNSKPKSQGDDPGGDHGYDKKSILTTGGLALALGVITWLLVPVLLPVKLPADFPKLPDLQNANPTLRKALENADREARRQPGSAEAVGALGMAYHANLYLEQAAQAYRIAARLAPKDYQWVYCQAFLQEENGNEEEQLKLLRETARLKPDYVPALLKLADASFKLDRLDEAAHYYESASKVPGGAATLQAAFGLGRVSARRQQWNQVVAYLVPLSHDYAYVQPPIELLQQAYEALGQKDKVQETAQSLALSKWKVVPPPDDPLNDRLIAVCYSSTRLLKQAGLMSRLGHPDRAIALARRAAEVEPSDADVRSFLARTLLTSFPDKPEAIDEALTQLAECLRLRPNDPVPLWSFTNDFFDTPKTPAATERLQALLRPYSSRPDSHFYLGLAADAQGNAQEAFAQYQEALKNNPNDSKVYTKLGLILDKAGKFDGAIAYLQKSVELNPMNTVARFNLGLALMQRGNYPRGLKELGELLRLTPHDAPTYFCMGFAYLYSNQADEAIARFREGLRYKPDDAEAHYGLGSALSIRRRHEEALVEAREALRLRPDYPEAQQLLHQLER